MEQVLHFKLIKEIFQKNAFLINLTGAKLILSKKQSCIYCDASNPIMRNSEENNDAILRNNLICISL